MQIKVKKLDKTAVLPTYATAGAACFDLYAVGSLASINNDPDHPNEWFDTYSVVVRTGLAFEIPEGYVMLVYSRSGHGFKNNVRLGNCVGVIDSDYRGELKVMLTADEGGSMVIKGGDRIAQAMIIPVNQVSLVEVNELSSTDRGTGGFGSTGA